MNGLSLSIAYLMAEPFEIPQVVAEDLTKYLITYLNFYPRFSFWAVPKHGFLFFPRNFVAVVHSTSFDNFSKVFF